MEAHNTTHEQNEATHNMLKEHTEMLKAIRDHQAQSSGKERSVLDKKIELAEKQKKANEAFAARVDQGKCEDIDRDKLQIKVLQEKVRQHQQKANRKIGNWVRINRWQGNAFKRKFRGLVGEVVDTTPNGRIKVKFPYVCTEIFDIHDVQDLERMR